jgi:hypothetical protein
MCNNNPCKCGRKVIDWNKPLQTTNKKYKVEVVRVDPFELNRALVSWKCGTDDPHDLAHAFVNNRGELLATLHGGVFHQENFIENIPEEPRNRILLVKDDSDGGWRTHTFDKFNGKPLFTETEAQDNYKKYAARYDAIIVTVPNTKG